MYYWFWHLVSLTELGDIVHLPDLVLEIDLHSELWDAFFICRIFYFKLLHLMMLDLFLDKSWMHTPEALAKHCIAYNAKVCIKDFLCHG